MIKLNSNYSVDIIKGKSITVLREGHSPRTFKVGDQAEYDSYNLSYFGIIRQITDKTVTIEAYPNSSMAKKYRLKLDHFSWRNWDFDLQKTQEKNRETMMYI